MDNEGFVIGFPFVKKQKIATIGAYGDRSTITINSTTTQSIYIKGNYLSGNIIFNNNNTILYAGYGTDTHTLEFPECLIYNEAFPKGDTLNLTCNEGGSATFNYQFADIVVI